MVIKSYLFIYLNIKLIYSQVCLKYWHLYIFHIFILLYINYIFKKFKFNGWISQPLSLINDDNNYYEKTVTSFVHTLLEHCFRFFFSFLGFLSCGAYTLLCKTTFLHLHINTCKRPRASQINCTRIREKEKN